MKYSLAFLISTVLVMACGHKAVQIEKVEMQEVSLILDTIPPIKFIHVLEARTDTSIKLILSTPVEDSMNYEIIFPEFEVHYDNYRPTEIFIDSFIGHSYSSQIVVSSRALQVFPRVRAVDALKIARRFHLPIFADKNLLLNVKADSDLTLKNAKTGEKIEVGEKIIFNIVEDVIYVEGKLVGFQSMDSVISQEILQSSPYTDSPFVLILADLNSHFENVYRITSIAKKYGAKVKVITK